MQVFAANAELSCVITFIIYRVFENRVLSKISQPGRRNGGKLLNEEVHDMYWMPNTIGMIQSRSMRWVGHLARMEKNINTYRVLVGGPEEKRALGRPRQRWKGNCKLDLKEIGWEGVNSIQLSQDIKNNQLL